MTAALDQAAERAALAHFERDGVRIVSEEIGISGEGRYTVSSTRSTARRTPSAASRTSPLRRGRRGRHDRRRRLRLRLRLRRERGVDGRSRRRRLPGRQAVRPARPRDSIEFLSIEATSAELVLDRLAKLAPLTEKLRIMGAQAITLLPSRRRPHRRRRRASSPRGRSTSPPRSSSIRERGFAIQARRRRADSARSRSTSRLARGLRRGEPTSSPDARRALGRALAGTLSRDGALSRRNSRRAGDVIDPELRKPVTELDMVRDVPIAAGTSTSRSRSRSPAARCATPSRSRSRARSEPSRASLGAARVRRDERPTSAPR